MKNQLETIELVSNLMNALRDQLCVKYSNPELANEMDTVKQAEAWLEKQVDSDPWHEAVLNACMSTEACYVEADPVGSVNRLIDWHIANEKFHEQQIIKSQCITEQDAKSIAESYFNYRTSVSDEDASFISSFFKPWLLEEGRTLLAKLNENREAEAVQEPDWFECEKLADNPDIHEAYMAFADDPTQDQATILASLIIKNYKWPVTANKAEEALNACITYIVHGNADFRGFDDALCNTFKKLIDKKSVDNKAEVQGYKNAIKLLRKAEREGNHMKCLGMITEALELLPPLKDDE